MSESNDKKKITMRTYKKEKENWSSQTNKCQTQNIHDSLQATLLINSRLHPTLLFNNLQNSNTCKSNAFLIN